MSKKTFFVAQPFEAGKRGALRPGVPVEARTAEDAERIARRLSLVKAGAVAFSRAVDPESQDEGDPPVLIASFGQVPDEVLELA